MREIYQIALSQLCGIGPVKAKTLIAHAGSAEAVFKSTIRELAAITGIGYVRARNLNRDQALKRAEKELNFIAKNDISLLYYLDDNYPSLLSFCEDAPIVLFTKGNVQFDQRNIAVVGTRKATRYGSSLTQQFVSDLSSKPVQIISGLAHGIDRIAHESALKNNLPTLAVLGHGLDLVYPARHKKLAEQLLENGGLVTEYLSETPGDPAHFPQRNRIVAGLSEATVVVESGIKGGSLITARMANEYNRDVFAFPGNIGSIYSEGCHKLIRNAQAHLITSANDLIDFLDLEGQKKDQNNSKTISLLEAVTKDETQVLDVFEQKTEEIHLDSILAQTPFSVAELSVLLFNLEMRGIVSSAPGNRFKLTA